MTLTICLISGALVLLVVVPIMIHQHQNKEKPPSGGGPSVKWEDPET